MKSAIILFVIIASLAACGVLYYKGFVDSPSAMMKNFNNPSNRIPAANLPEEIGADRFSKKPTTIQQQQQQQSPPSTSSSTVPSSSASTTTNQHQQISSNNNQRYIIDEKEPLSSKFLLSKRYDQTLSDYEQKNRKNLKKYLSDLEKPNLVKKINGLPIEPVDIWIGKGGKRLKMIKLLGREIINKGDYARDFLYSSNNNNNNQRRLVWFDLGARVWPKGSTQWFSRHYPNSTQFEVECYDVLDLEHSYPPKGKRPFKEFRFHSKAAWTKEGEVQIGGVKMASVARDDQVLDPKKVTVWKTKSIDFGQLLLHNYSEDAGFVRKSSFTDADADAEQSTRGTDVEEEKKKLKKLKKEKGKTSASAAIDGDITTYISEKKKNFIIVKMDIEGGEWPLIKHLEDTGALSRIDEMMLECHPPPADSEYVTSDKAWKPFKHGQMHPDCVRLINRMRLSGVYAHGWF